MTSEEMNRAMEFIIQHQAQLAIEMEDLAKLHKQDHHLLERQMGNADVIYKKRHGAATLVFGEKGDFPLLGVTALEALGLIFDPLHQRLKPGALTI